MRARRAPRRRAIPQRERGRTGGGDSWSREFTLPPPKGGETIGPMTWPPSEKVRWIATLAAFVLLLVMGALKRLEVLDAVSTGQIEGASPALSGDAASYYRLALGTPLPCFSTEREPMIL